MRALLATALLLGACTSVTGTPTPATTTKTVNDITAVESKLADVEMAAAAYAALPACGTKGAASVCSDPKIVAEIQTADRVAFAALQAAKTAAADGGAVDTVVVSAAVTAMSGLVPAAK